LPPENPVGGTPLGGGKTLSLDLFMWTLFAPVPLFLTTPEKTNKHHIPFVFRRELYGKRGFPHPKKPPEVVRGGLYSLSSAFFTPGGGANNRGETNFPWGVVKFRLFKEVCKNLNGPPGTCGGSCFTGNPPVFYQRDFGGVFPGGFPISMHVGGGPFLDSLFSTVGPGPAPLGPFFWGWGGDWGEMPQQRLFLHKPPPGASTDLTNRVPTKLPFSPLPPFGGAGPWGSCWSPSFLWAMIILTLRGPCSHRGWVGFFFAGNLTLPPPGGEIGLPPGENLLPQFPPQRGWSALAKTNPGVLGPKKKNIFSKTIGMIFSPPGFPPPAPPVPPTHQTRCFPFFQRVLGLKIFTPGSQKPNRISPLFFSKGSTNWPKFPPPNVFRPKTGRFTRGNFLTPDYFLFFSPLAISPDIFFLKKNFGGKN